MKVQNNSFLALDTVQYPSKGSVIWVIPTISFDYLFKTIFLGNIFYFSDFYPSVLERFADCLLEVQTSYENVTRLNMLCRDILLLHFPVLLHLLNCQFSLSPFSEMDQTFHIISVVFLFLLVSRIHPSAHDSFAKQARKLFFSISCPSC